jgi:deazaflavin-dependent oxidoreductase (nitroreductase family)
MIRSISAERLRARYAERLRAMYPNGRANASGRRYANLWARIFALGLGPRRWVTLEVVGRRTGRPTRFPLGMADLDGCWYLVSMLGEQCNWVQNVRAAGGAATIHHGRSVHSRLVEIPVADRAPILRRYLQKVPGGRPHLPCGRRASVSDLEAIAGRYPVFRVEPANHANGRRLAVPGRRRRRVWWILMTVGIVLVLTVTAVGALVSPTSLASLALPDRPAAAPAGSIEGVWSVSAGSVAGFRVPQTVLGFGSEVVGRTEAVTGTIAIAGAGVTAAAIRVALTTITVSGKRQPQLETSLGTSADPIATVRLAGLVRVSAAFAAGAAVREKATGYLTLHGITRLVVITIAARRNGSDLQVAGSIPVSFARWRIKDPAGFGFFGSLADHGSAEFLLTLRRAGRQ